MACFDCTASAHWFLWPHTVFIAVVSQKTNKLRKSWTQDLKDWTPSQMERYMSPFFDSPPHKSPTWILPCQILADHPSSRGTSRFWMHLTPVAFSYQVNLADSFDQLPASGSHDFWENRKCLVISCFFVPFSHTLSSLTLIQDHEVVSYKPMVDLLACQTGGVWANCFLLFKKQNKTKKKTPNKTLTAWIYLHRDIHVYVYLHLHIYMHTSLTLYYHIESL